MVKSFLSDMAWFLSLLGAISAPVYVGLLGLWAFTSLPTAVGLAAFLFAVLAWTQHRNWQHHGEADDKLGWQRMSKALEEYVELYRRKKG